MGEEKQKWMMSAKQNALAARWAREKAIATEKRCWNPTGEWKPLILCTSPNLLSTSPTSFVACYRAGTSSLRYVERLGLHLPRHVGSCLNTATTEDQEERHVGAPSKHVLSVPPKYLFSIRGRRVAGSGHLAPFILSREIEQIRSCQLPQNLLAVWRRRSPELIWTF